MLVRIDADAIHDRWLARCDSDPALDGCGAPPLANEVAVAMCSAMEWPALDSAAYQVAVQPLADAIAGRSPSIETALDQLGWLPDAYYRAAADGSARTVSPARLNLFVQRLMVGVAKAGLHGHDRTAARTMQPARTSPLEPSRSLLGPPRSPPSTRSIIAERI